LERDQVHDVGNSTYYLRYIVEYDDIVPENRPLYLAGCCDATGDLDRHGNIEYDIPKCDLTTNPGCVHTISTRQRIGTGNFIFNLGGNNTFDDREVELVYAVGHLHRAGLGIYLYNDTTDELICSSIPQYGTGHVAGNEATYVRAMTSCTFNPPRRMRTSDVVRIVASYNSTEAHTGVMSLWYMAISDVVNNDIEATTMHNSSIDVSTKSAVSVAVVLSLLVIGAIFGAYRAHSRKGYSQVPSERMNILN